MILQVVSIVGFSHIMNRSRIVLRPVKSVCVRAFPLQSRTPIWGALQIIFISNLSNRSAKEQKKEWINLVMYFLPRCCSLQPLKPCGIDSTCAKTYTLTPGIVPGEPSTWSNQSSARGGGRTDGRAQGRMNGRTDTTTKLVTPDTGESIFGSTMG